MGALISLIEDTYSTLRALVKTIATLNEQYQTILNRVNNPPAAPSANPTRPHWYHEAPFPELIDIHNEIPKVADVVIIGSGITGASAARALIQLASRPLKIVVLESRQLCSGATGRNGGHIKCTPYEMFDWKRQVIGDQKAAEVTRFHMRHLQVLQEVGEQVPEGQVREVETVDFFIDQEQFEKAKKMVEEAQKWIPEFEHHVWTAEEAKAKFGANDFVVGAISYQAGAVWPYRLVTSIWNALVKEHAGDVSISTHTTVESVTARPGEETYAYQVKTSRGSIDARHVIHATNAYAPYLVPSLRGYLAGLRAHMTAQRPGDDFPVQSPERSWGISHEPDFEYITQLAPDGKRDEKQGLLMVGGAFSKSIKQGMDQVGIWDDDDMEALTTMTVTGSMQTVFEKWGAGGEVVSAWSGIVGMSGDLMPFVGRIAEESKNRASGGDDNGLAAPGQWISAGYSGDGMVSAWLSAAAVAIMILGLEDIDLKARNGIPGGKLKTWFPEQELGLSKQRMRRAHVSRIAEKLS